MTTAKSISIPAVIYAMLQELSDKNRKKPEQYLHNLIKSIYIDGSKWFPKWEYEKKRAIEFWDSVQCPGC